MMGGEDRRPEFLGAEEKRDLLYLIDTSGLSDGSSLKVCLQCATYDYHTHR